MNEHERWLDCEAVCGGRSRRKVKRYVVIWCGALVRCRPMFEPMVIHIRSTYSTQGENKIHIWSQRLFTCDPNMGQWDPNTIHIWSTFIKRRYRHDTVNKLIKNDPHTIHFDTNRTYIRSTFDQHVIHVWSTFDQHLIHDWSTFDPLRYEYQPTFDPHTINFWSTFDPQMIRIRSKYDP